MTRLDYIFLPTIKNVCYKLNRKESELFCTLQLQLSFTVNEMQGVNGQVFKNEERQNLSVYPWVSRYCYHVLLGQVQVLISEYFLWTTSNMSTYAAVLNKGL